VLHAAGTWRVFEEYEWPLQIVAQVCEFIFGMQRQATSKSAEVAKSSGVSDAQPT